MKTQSTLLACFMIACGSNTIESSNISIGLSEAPALTCEERVLKNLDRACDTVRDETQPIISRTFSFDSGRRIRSDIQGYGIHLVEAPVTNEGQVTFIAPTTGPHIAYLGTPNVPFEIARGFRAVEPECSVRLNTDECFLLRRGVLYELEAGEVYSIRFGPITPQRWVRFMLVDLSFRAAPECGPEGPLSVEFACEAADTIKPRRLPMPPITNSAGSFPPLLETVYGLRLSEGAEDNSGARAFTIDIDGLYTFYLGTPDIQFVIRNIETGQKVPAECQSRLFLESCNLFRRAYQYNFSAGTEYRMELGPIMGNRWVRFFAAQELE